MKIRRVSFRRDMRVAIDAGLKTQTRRPVKHPGKRVARFVPSLHPRYWIEQYDNGDPIGVLTGGRPVTWTSNGASIRCPCGEPGDHFSVLGRTYEITSVRVEQVQAISEEDAIAEGDPYPLPRGGDSPQWFRQIWDSVYRKTFPWSSNCFVWVITFRRIDDGE